MYLNYTLFLDKLAIRPICCSLWSVRFRIISRNFDLDDFFFGCKALQWIAMQLAAFSCHCLSIWNTLCGNFSATILLAGRQNNETVKFHNLNHNKSKSWMFTFVKHLTNLTFMNTHVLDLIIWRLYYCLLTLHFLRSLHLNTILSSRLSLFSLLM